MNAIGRLLTKVETQSTPRSQRGNWAFHSHVVLCDLRALCVSTRVGCDGRFQVHSKHFLAVLANALLSVLSVKSVVKSASCSWKSSRTHGAFTGLSRNSGIRSNMRTLILSDIHLGSRHCNAELVNEVLDQERYDRLVLNGDTIN